MRMRWFTVAELTRSDTAEREGIDNRLPESLLPNVENLIIRTLDPLREWYGRPVYVNSGYRCPELNKAVGGASGSFHLDGCAADLDTRLGKSENRRLFEYIRDNLPYTELGWEGGGRWVHVALVPGREREKEVFYA